MKKYIIFALLLMFLPIFVFASGNDEIVTDNETNYNVFEKEVSAQSCESLLGSPKEEGTPAFYLSIIFKVIKYIAIVILIVFTSMDLLSSIVSQDDESIKKSISKLFKRMTICALIFLMPTIIELGLQFIHNKVITTCGIGI